MTKVRVNITVDRETLVLAKRKLGLFGGKLSTLFDAYLRDFVKSMDKEYGADYKVLQEKVVELEEDITILKKSKITQEDINEIAKIIKRDTAREFKKL